MEQSQRSLVTFVADFDFGALDSAGPSTLWPDDDVNVSVEFRPGHVADVL